MPKIAIIVLAFNGENFLPKCFNALTKTNYPKEDLFFFLVDNGSTDHSREIFSLFQKEHSEFHIETVFNKKNLGFAAGNNVGFTYALQKKVDYVLTLNQDIQDVDPDWVLHLVETLESHPKIAAVQARVMLYPETTLINSIGNKFHFLGFGFCEGNGKLYRNEGESVREIMYASGSVLLIRASLVEKYGGFQEETFMYHDDVELCLRFRLLGYSIVINNDAVVYHEYEFHRSIKKYFWMERNRIWMLLEYYRVRTWLLVLPIFLIMELGILIFSLRSGFFLAKVRGYGDILLPWNLFRVFRRRKYIQSIRRISDRELLHLATPIIADQEIKNPVLEFLVNPFMRFYWNIIKRIL